MKKIKPEVLAAVGKPYQAMAEDTLNKLKAVTSQEQFQQLMQECDSSMQEVASKLTVLNTFFKTNFSLKEAMGAPMRIDAESLANLFTSPIPATAPRGLLREMQSYLEGAIAVYSNVVRSSKGVRLVEAVRLEDTSNRLRMNADRRAFVLAENALNTVQTLKESAANVNEPSAADVVPSLLGRDHAESKKRSSLRGLAEAKHHAAFGAVFSEAVYKAIPMDEEEKSPSAEFIRENCNEVFAQADFQNPSAMAHEIRLQVAPLAEKAADVEGAVAAVREACGTAGTTLNKLVCALAEAIETRVLDAVVSNNQRSALMSEMVEAVALEEDAGLAELRRRRVEREFPPTLLESLYIANKRNINSAINEGTSPEVPASVILTESICQYTLLETASALGMLSMKDPTKVARAVAGR